MKKVKIIATIGPASDKKEILEELVDSGMDAIRLNMSHGNYEEQIKRVNLIREINKEKNKNIAILMDTKGPEVRTGNFENGKVFLKQDAEVIITMEDVIGNAEKFTITYKKLSEDIKPGNIILLDDGYISLKVLGIKGQEINCKILNSGYIKDKKGVNVPGVTLGFDFMSKKDKEDIIWACKNNLDFIAASFIRQKKDIDEIKEIIKEQKNDRIQIIAKIESQDGVNNIEEIIDTSDGIMVARGDLGVEIPYDAVPVIQKGIIKQCNQKEKIVITATQMLESMQNNPRPTRAEVSDVFNAVIDGTDAVMLSGESAAGDYPVESVQTQSTIVQKAEKIFDYETYMENMYKILKPTISELVAYSTVSTADKISNVKLIIAITNSGATAKKISRLKPVKNVLVVTPSRDVARSLSLNFGINAAVIEKQENTDDLLEAAITKAKQLNLIFTGDSVAISAGSINGKGNTDLMKVRTVN